MILNRMTGLLMQSHYWCAPLCPYHPFPHANFFLSSRYHNELFPHVYQPTDEDLIEISDILAYSIGGS